MISGKSPVRLTRKPFWNLPKKLAFQAQKGTPPAYILSMLEALAAHKSELPWNLYLKQVLGTVANARRKRRQRRNRRQPDRLDLRGELAIRLKSP